MGYCILSQTVVDKVSLTLSFGSYRTHLWILLLGPSTKAKKSTTINLARDILVKAGMKNFMPTDFSPEGLIEHLSDFEKGYMWCDEIGGLLKHFNRDYMSNSKELLMKMYSGQSVFRKLRDKSFMVDDPSVGIVGNTTLETMMDAMRTTDMYTGFGARFMQVHWREEAVDNWEPIVHHKDGIEDLKQSLVDDVKLIRNKFQIDKDMKFSDDALDKLNEWNKDIMDSVGETRSSTFGSLYGRLSDYLIKFSMLTEISDNWKDIRPTDQNLIISENSIMKSVNMIDDYLCEIESNLMRQLHGAERIRVYDTIKENEPISRTKLLRKLHMDSSELSKHLRTLKDMALIKGDKKKTTTRSFSKPATFYETTIISMED